MQNFTLTTCQLNEYCDRELFFQKNHPVKTESHKFEFMAH